MSESRSQSGSRSSSRSSSNSMRLPDPAPAGEEQAAQQTLQDYPPASIADGPEEAAAAANGAPARELPSIFIGMGPAGRHVTTPEMTEFLRSKAQNPDNIRDVRVRGRCGFADTTTVAEAKHLIAQLNDQDYRGLFRMTVEMSKQSMAEARERRRERIEESANKQLQEGRLVNNGRQVFVNLGPRGKDIPDSVIRERVEPICPIMRYERRGYCAYIDVPSAEDTKRVVSALNDMMINDVRMIVQVSATRPKRARSPPTRGGREVARRDRDVRRDEHRRHRSDSRERRHRHRRSRRSYTPSSRSSSSYSSRSRSHSRGRRSYSPDSVDSRDRRERRGGRREAEPRRAGAGERRERRGPERRERR